MSPGSPHTAGARSAAIATVVIRWGVGALFIYMGLSKALDPVDFLKLVRQYDLVQQHLVLNVIASALPWFEVFCGGLLVAGVAVRGAALISALMLVPFTFLVLLRALAIQKVSGLAFCAIKFDCGCGAGEVFICMKLLENTLLTLASIWLIAVPRQELCLRHALFPNLGRAG
jgi:uncharacterized membrane protein YphA (DoxX/SURF4 family)